MTRRQCSKCPWRVDVDPTTIPNGYSRRKHARLESTIAEPGRFCAGTMQMMACHETKRGKELPCVGWLANQLGDGNNIALRLAVIRGQVSDDFEIVGEQHATFEETLP